jgi:phosphoadenosine phosphosulfate reductase
LENIDSWPVGGIDPVLSDLQERYVPDLAHVDLPGLICDPALSDMAIVSSFGAESAVLLHYVYSIKPGVKVLFLDTKKHFSKTLAYRDRLVDLLGLNLQVVEPDPHHLFTEDPAENLFERNPHACCRIRKTLALQDALVPFHCWISGRKRYQSEGRANIPLIERDGAKIKLNPMAIWKRESVAEYFDRHALPRHPLEALGYASIGCEPCTRPVAEGEESRAGRWAHVLDKTECGIHLSPDGKFIRPS